MQKHILIALMLLATIGLNAQRGQYQGGPKPKGNISGQLLDKNSNEPILYASVALYKKRDSSLATGAMSGEKGIFEIKDVEAGRYYMVIKFVGYEKDTINNIMLRPPELNKNLGKIYLQSASKNLAGVEIVAEKTYVEYKIDKKVVNVGKDLNSAGGTAVDALENVPSVTVDIDDNVELRGSSSFTVFINGKPTPLSGSDALQQIPVGAIKNIEIITNPSAKYDPDGMTGIINVVLKENIKQGINGLIDIGVSSFNQYNFNGIFSYKVGKFNIYLGGNYNDHGAPGTGHSDLATTFGDTTTYRITDLDRNRRRSHWNLKGGFDYAPNKKNTFTFEGSFGKMSHNKDYSSHIYEYNSPKSYDLYTISQNPGTRDDSHYKLFGNWEYKLDGKGSNIQTFAYISNSNEEQDDMSKEYISDKNWALSDSLIMGNHTTESETAPDYRFKIDLTKYLKNKKRFESGLQARVRPEVHHISYSKFDTDIGWQDLPDYGSELNFERQIYSGYGTYSGEYKTFGYQFGLRGEYTYRNVIDNTKDYNFKINRFDIFPTVHFSKKFPNKHQILLSYSRRIDRPGGWELEPSTRFISSNFQRRGNPELQPEYMDNFELSYQKVIDQSFVSVEGYYHTTKNKVTRIQSVDSTGMVLMTFENLDRDHAAGVEVMLNARLVKWLNINVSGNYYYYQLVSNSGSFSDLNTTSNNFDMRGNVNFVITKTTKLQITGFYRGASITAQGKRDPFFVTSASMRQDLFKRKLSVVFRVRDIFNTMQFQFVTIGENFTNLNSFSRKSPIFTLSLSYRINNYKEKKGPRGFDDGQGGGDNEM